MTDRDRISQATTAEEMAEIIKKAKPNVSREDMDRALADTTDEELSMEELEGIAGGFIVPPPGNN
jgi:hypothetical protein